MSEDYKIRLEEALNDIIVMCAPDAEGKYDLERIHWEVEQIARHALNSDHPRIPYNNNYHPQPYPFPPHVSESIEEEDVSAEDRAIVQDFFRDACCAKWCEFDELCLEYIATRSRLNGIRTAEQEIEMLKSEVNVLRRALGLLMKGIPDGTEITIPKDTSALAEACAKEIDDV